MFHCNFRTSYTLKHLDNVCDKNIREKVRSCFAITTTKKTKNQTFMQCLTCDLVKKCIC